MDKWLGDSFRVVSTKRLVEVGLQCAVAAAERSKMMWVVGKVSKGHNSRFMWLEMQK